MKDHKIVNMNQPIFSTVYGWEIKGGKMSDNTKNILIILDYRNGKVAVMPNKGTTQEEMEDQIMEWCRNSETSLSDCEWMAWDGNIKHEI